MYYKILLVNIRYVRSNHFNIFLSSRIFTMNIKTCIDKCNKRIRDYNLSKDEIIFLSKYATQNHFKFFNYFESCKIFIDRYPESAKNSLVYSRDRLEIVKYLIERGADVHVENNLALRSASRYSCLEVIKCLVEQGANIHIHDDEPLSYASHNGHLNIVKYLVENGANIHAKNSIALIFARDKGHLAVVEYLESKMNN